MRYDYRGYLLSFGGYQMPNNFLTEYSSTPNQRMEKKAWRDNNEDLHRVTSDNFKSTLKPVIRSMSQDEFDLFMSIRIKGLIDTVQRKYRVKYWNVELMQYSEGEFYIPDIEYKLSHITDNKTGEMYYESFTMEMIQY